MSSHIRTKYAQYKEDTKKLGNWLAESALNFGYPASSFELSSGSDDTPQRTAQQVKYAKKKAKQKAKAKIGGGSAEMQASVTVEPVQELPADTMRECFLLGCVCREGDSVDH
jgi:hypothetical protein